MVHLRIEPSQVFVGVKVGTAAVVAVKTRAKAALVLLALSVEPPTVKVIVPVLIFPTSYSIRYFFPITTGHEFG
jgi:ribosomal protein L7Ae-like RNA K-turn-binding protein